MEQQAGAVARGVYPVFCQYMQQPQGDVAGLLSALQDLDQFLGGRDTRFLLGNDMSSLDKEVLPQLHEIRVVMDRMRGHSIPENLSKLWMYLFHAYRQNAFTSTCPPDLEILHGWLEKTGEPASIIRMPQWLPESHHGTYRSFKVPNMCVCPSANEA